MGKRGSGFGSTAAIWLATTIVLVLGAVGTAFVILISAPDDYEVPLMVWAGIFTGIILLIAVFNIRWEEPVNQLKFWLSFQNKPDPADAYDAARRRTKHREEYGNLPPPSVESVRDAANHGGAWVPRSNSDRTRPRK